MKTLLILATAIGVLVPRVRAQAPAPASGAIAELEALRAPYLKSLAALRATRDARAEPVTKSYLSALERLETESTGRGDVLGAAAIKAEHERVGAKKEPTAQQRKDMPTALTALRDRYEQDLARNAAPFQQQEQQLTRQYVSSLDTAQRRLTAQNQVAKAAAVSAEREAMAVSLGKVPARETPTSAASTVRSKGQLEPALADKIAATATAKSYTKSANSTEDGDTEGWVEAPEDGALLVGFEFMEASSDTGNRVRSLRPYYLTRKGIVAGKDRGKMEKITDKILARDGYAVAGLLTLGKMNGMQVIFMKIDPVTGAFDTNPSNTYKSKWYGTKIRGTPKQVSGSGRFVIGVYGKTGSDCDNIGVLEMK